MAGVGWKAGIAGLPDPRETPVGLEMRIFGPKPAFSRKPNLFQVSSKPKITSNVAMNQVDPIYAVLNSGWFALLGLLVGLLGIGISYIFYRRGKPKTELRDMLSEVELIGVTPTKYSDGLEVRFEGRQIPQVTNSTYAIWNAGTTTLHGRDIVEKEPLRLALQGEGRILRAEVDASTRPVISAWVASDEKTVRLGFDYLDAGDGFRVTVLHSGVLNSLSSLGTIKGVPQGLLRHDPSKGFWLGMRIFIIAFAAIMVPLIGWMFFLILAEVWVRPLQNSWPILTFFIAIFVVIPYLAWRDSKKSHDEKRTIGGMPDALSEGARFYIWPSMSSSMGSNPYGPD